jgi:hypothetical protein
MAPAGIEPTQDLEGSLQQKSAGIEVTSDSRKAL